MPEPKQKTGNPERPKVIAAFMGHRTLGNFTMNQIAAASVARAAGPGTKLLSIYRSDRPYKDLINLCNPTITRTLRLPADPNVITPLDWFEGRHGVAGAPTDEAWYEDGYHRPDIVLTPAQLRIEHCMGTPPPFHFPVALEGAMEMALRQLGLKKNNWFAVVHLREIGYEHRRGVSQERTVNPLDYLPALNRIIEKHGGQVVRVGDPSMTPLPPTEGLIDLSRIPDSFPLQAFALARARFFFGTDSGPTQLASAFKTPVASTNAFGIAVWNDGDIVLNKRVIRENGSEIPTQELFDMGTWTVHRNWPSGSRVENNTQEQLKTVVDRIVETTATCTEWRQNADMPPFAPQSLGLPLQWREVTDIADITLWE